MTNKTHYTPPSLVRSIIEFFDGEISLDPCSPIEPNIPASKHYSVLDNGLKMRWEGKVFVNPPYTRDFIINWIKKSIHEFEKGYASEILLLVPCDTSTKWFHRLNKYPRLYFNRRIKFVGEEKENKSCARFASCMFYLGTRTDKFITYWQKFGLVTLGAAKPKFDKSQYQREYMRMKRKKKKPE